MKTTTTTLDIEKASKLAMRALTKSGATRANARYLVESIIDSELVGMASHGFFWLPVYCSHLKCGKVDGKVKPMVTRLSPVSFRADAGSGFAHPAIEKGFARLIPAAKKYGIAGLAVTNSYNCGRLGGHTERLAREGLLAMGYTNSPASIAPAGGIRAVIGTNPISMAAPDGKGGIGYVIDQSSSVVAKSEVMRHAARGEDIPLGWAIDAEGNPTTDPTKMATMAPAGGYKGFGQGLMVETMSSLMSGAQLGSVMSPFATDAGGPCNSGQFFIAIDPEGFSAGLFADRFAGLAGSITSQEGARLPGLSRLKSREESLARGTIEVGKDLIRRVREHTRTT
jgi:(2R)-3-sulfolactate dehydrogenase (NADP+)